MLLRLYIIAFLFSPIFALGQQFHFKNYSLEQGLPRVGVYDIYQDTKGYLWIGTEGGGVCKFDGKNFHSYTRRNGLPSDDVRVIFAASDNTLWFATANGICYFQNNQFYKVDLPDSTAANKIRAIAEDDEGRLWLGSKKGLAFINSKTKQPDLEFNPLQPFLDNNVRALKKIDDVIWIGTDLGIYLYANKKIEPYVSQLNIAGHAILDIYLDSKKNIWVGTQTGLSKIDLANNISSWTTADGLVYDRVKCVTEDQYGNIWIGTSQGINVYDGYEFITITSLNGLSNDRIRCLKVDNFNNIWVGTFFGGIMRYNYKDFTGFTTAEGLASNQVQSVCEDEYGDILVGTNAGFSHLEIVNNKLYNYSTIQISEGFGGNSILAIYYDKNGYTWLGTSSGVTILKQDYKSDIVLAKDELGTVTSVSSVHFFNNTYWVGTTNGLFTIKPDSIYSTFDIKQPANGIQLGGIDIACQIQDKAGRIWFGFADGTVSVLFKNSFYTPIVPDALKNVSSLAVDSTNQIWIGTNGNGVFYGTFDEATKKLDLKNLSTTDNLSSDYIYSILINGDDIWLGHEKGIDILLAPKDTVHKVLHCGSETGFKGLQNFPNAAFKDSQGSLWFGTMNGLYRLNGREVDSFAQGKAAILYMQNIRIDGQEVDWKKSTWCDSISADSNMPLNLVLPFNKNNLLFEFIGLNYVAPEKVKYSWMLEGYDEDWNLPSKDNHVSYTNLPPGDYVFKVKASNDLGIIQDTEISYAFKIKKPFWQTWWFRITAILLATLIGVLIMRNRTRHLREKQKELEKIIEQRTAEITNQNEVLEEKNKEITDSIFYSRRIQRSILPTKEKVNKLLDEYFVFFRPKDIVSGDFYWAEKSLDKSKLFFAVADCTGHGVPGAMVSLIGTRALNSALREAGIDKANEILDHVNEIMIEAFTDNSSDIIIKDGMDIALCSIDYSAGEKIAFQYAGAQNSVWLVRPENDDNIFVNGLELEPNLISSGYKLFEIKADKQPIGYFETRVPFSNKEAILKKGDRIYLFSDGFADQFGGEKGKKFKYKTLKELILNAQEKSVREQYGEVRTAFYDWKREFEQIDDVCLMGVEI